MVRFSAAIRTLFVAALFIGGSVWIAEEFAAAWGRNLVWPIPEEMEVGGIAFLVVGLSIIAWCLTCFVFVGEGTPAPFDPPRKFVTVGPYRYSRNPMYIGGFLAVIGYAGIRESWPIICFSFLWILFFHGFVMLYEEPALRVKFGEDYKIYCRKIPRWLGRRKDI